MTSLVGICRPLCMAKTVKLQRTHCVLLCYSASCQPVDFFSFLPFKELTFGVGHHHVAETGSRAELLSQQFDVLREDLSAFLRAQKKNLMRHPRASTPEQQALRRTSTFSGLAGFFSSSSFIRGLSWYTSARLILQHTAWEYNRRDGAGGKTSGFTGS